MPPPPSYGPSSTEGLQPSPPPLPAVGSMSITDAFTNMNSETEDLTAQPSTMSQPSTMQGIPSPPKQSPAPLLRKSFGTDRSASKKTLTPTTTDDDPSELQELQKAIQQLRAENISLRAQVG